MSGEFDKLINEAAKAVDIAAQQPVKKQPAVDPPVTAPAAVITATRTSMAKILVRALALGLCAGFLYAMFTPVNISFMRYFLQQGHDVSTVRTLLFITNFVSIGGITGIVSLVLMLAFRK